MRQVTITIKYAEVTKDVALSAYVIADANGQSEHQKHNLADITQDENKARVNRIIDIAFLEARQILLSAAKTPITMTEADNSLPQVDGEKTIVLNLPDTLPQESADLITPYVHEYIVWKTLLWWCNLVFPAASQTCLQNIDNAEKQIRSAITRRMGHTTRPLSPF